MFEELCTITELNQISGEPTTVVEDLVCSSPFPYMFRQTRAETAYDFQPMQCFTAVPETQIKENMRMQFADGQNFRIHSVNKWPMVNTKFLEIVLHGDGAI